MSVIDENCTKCRTCSTEINANEVVSVSEIEIGIRMTLYDGCMDGANITIKDTGKLSTYICTVCLQMLKNAISFVRVANQNWLDSVGNCLAEAPIDMKECMQIEMETAFCGGQSTTRSGVFGGGCRPAECASECHREIPEKVSNQSSSDPIAVVQTCASDKSQGAESPNECVNASGNAPKRSRGRPRLNKTEPKISGDHTKTHRFACEVCGKTFAWKKDLLRHGNSHFLAPSYECDTCGRQFLRKDKLKDHQKIHRKRGNSDYEDHTEEDSVDANVMSSSGCNYGCNASEAQKLEARFECCLCSKECESLCMLRAHLLQHADGSQSFNLTEGKFFQVHYATANACTAKEIEQSIADDFAAKDMTRFYLAVDESGNEMDLNDSETDGEEESAGNKFGCELCGRQFNGRKSILQHQSAEHAGVALPHVCSECRRSFVCMELMQDHLNRHCLNRHKKHQCEKCTARFVWPMNLQRHIELKHSNDMEQPVKCQHCEKRFVGPNDLTRHLRVHLPDLPRHFNRKDNMHTHMREHGANEAYAAVGKKELSRSKQTKVKGIDENSCKPHGCKDIQCMICLSKHTKITDLRAHLLTHKQAVSFDGRLAEDSVEHISQQLYPAEATMPLDVLAAKVCADVSANRLAHLYSITDELGYELSLNSSETESDSDSEVCNRSATKYTCDLCGASYRRKYQIFEHQLHAHDWLEAKHVCAHCNQRFVSPCLLEHHYRQQCRNTAKCFQCRKCPRRFMWRDNLQLHLRSCHAPRETEPSHRVSPQVPQSFDCRECGRGFRMQKDLTRHMHAMHRSDAAVFKCLWCPRRFYRLENLHMHVRRHDVRPEQLKAAECIIKATSNPHGCKLVQCRACHLKFDTVSTLRAHLLQVTHHNQACAYSITDAQGYEMDLDDSATDDDAAEPSRHYTCAICKLVCQRQYEMIQHQRSIHKHELLPHKCERCVFRAVSPEILEHHKRMHCFNESKRYACDECPFKFAWSDNLEQHKKREHAEQAVVAEHHIEASSKPNEPNSAAKYFSCDQCPRKYNRKDRLTAHMKKFHGPGAKPKPLPRTRSVPEKEKAQAPKQKFLCAFCGRAVTSSSNLIIHMRRHTGEKPFKCDFCEMAFPRSSDLQCHRRTHTGEKPHQCTVCQKAFSRSYKLQTHMRIHSGERPYKCTFCEKSFTQSNDLTLHIRRHTGERPYVCEVCGERFIQGTALKYHRIMHGHPQEAS